MLHPPDCHTPIMPVFNDLHCVVFDMDLHWIQVEPGLPLMPQARTSTNAHSPVTSREGAVLRRKTMRTPKRLNPLGNAALDIVLLAQNALVDRKSVV